VLGKLQLESFDIPKTTLASLGASFGFRTPKEISDPFLQHITLNIDVPSVKKCEGLDRYNEVLRRRSQSRYANFTWHQNDALGVSPKISCKSRSIGGSVASDEENLPQLSSQMYFAGVPELARKDFGWLPNRFTDTSENRLQDGNRIDSPPVQLL
jgi:hypothetical protein